MTRSDEKNVVWNHMNGGIVNCDIDFSLLAGEDFMKIEMLMDWTILTWIENCH